MSILHKRIRVWPVVVALLLLAIGGAYAFYVRHPYIERAIYDYPLVQQGTKLVESVVGTSTGSAVTVDEFVEKSTPDMPLAATDKPVQPADPLPAQIRIQVPFQSQAPHGNWNMPYQEACEEASLILVHHYLQGTPVTAEEMDQQILDLVKVENDEFGYSADVTMEELSEVARKHYDYETELFYEFDIDDMKRLLAEGHPIIVPLAGRQLSNPYYSGLGPWYHVLVITGYDEESFITNDVGTRRGEGYKYPFHRIYDNIHNWTGVKEDITNGRRVMLVVRE